MYYIIKTAGLAGGLFLPYKGLLLAGLKALENPPTAIVPELPPKGGLFSACVHWLTRKRVYQFFYAQLFIRQVLLQLVSYILCYCLFVLSYCIYIVSSAPELSVPVSVLQIRMLVKYHQAAFPF